MIPAKEPSQRRRVDEEIDGVDMDDVGGVGKLEPRRRNRVPPRAEIRNAMNRNGVDLRGRCDRASALEIPIESHDFDVMTARDEAATQVEHAALDASDFRIELPRNLKDAHQPPGRGTISEKV